MADFSPPLLQNTLQTDSLKKKLSSLPPKYVSFQQLQERRLKEQQQRQQKEREAKEEEERKRQLELEKSLQTLGTKAASDRSSRRYEARYRPRIIEKRSEIAGAAREIEGQGKSIEEWRKKKSNPKERRTLTDGHPAKSLPESGKQEEVPKPEGEKSGGRGFRSATEYRTVRIAQEIGNLGTDGRKEANERSTPEKKVGNERLKGRGRRLAENLPEKVGSKVTEHRAVEIDQKINCDDEMERSDGREEADKAPERKRNVRLKRKNNRRKRMAEIAQKEGNVGNVDCDQTVGEAEGGDEVDERLTAENEHGNAEKTDTIDQTVEIAHKIRDLRVVGCDGVGGKRVGERSMAEKKLGNWRSRDGRSFGRGRVFGYGRGFGYGERRDTQHWMWVRKEENSN